MAIINSLAIGKSVKSAGNLTYKTVRGRTIASQRITQNKSNTFLQQVARGGFSQVSKCITLCQSWIDKTFEKSKYGSSRNNFFKLNPKFKLGNNYSLVIGGKIKLDAAFVSCFNNYSEVAEKEVNYLSYGSAPCVVSETAETLTEVEVSGSTWNKVRCTSDTVFTFPSGVSIENLKILFVYFIPETPDQIFIGEVKFKTSESGKIDFDWDNSDQKAAGVFTTSSDVYSSDGIISSVDFIPDYTIKTISAGFFVPIVAGKIAKVTLPFVHNSNL